MTRGVRDAAGQRAPHLVLHAGGEHRVGALDDAPLELFAWHVEAEDERRVPRLPAPQRVPAGLQRFAELRQLERADDAAAVVRVDALGCKRISFGERGMGTLGPQTVVESLPALPIARWRRRQVGEAARR